MAPAAALGPYDSSEANGRLLLRELEGLGLYQGERFLGCRPLAAPDTFLLLTRRCAASGAGRADRCHLCLWRFSYEQNECRLASPMMARDSLV